jgi:site-specific DNA-methyltransferase (cytosine-N4-specific)
MLSETIKRIDKIHPYPAKFTIDIAIKLIEKHSKIGDVVYDPFLGSGTTILACNLLERKAIGTDINHIAILISKFKTIVLNHKEKKELSYLIEVLKNLKEDNIVLLHHYKSIDHWFKKDVVLALSSILNNINLIKSINSKIFAQTIFSSIINLVSNQESDTRYAAIEKKVLNFNYVIELFIKKIQNALILQEDLGVIDYKNFGECYLHDSLKSTEIIKSKVDLIMTSPPYPNTYDYYLYHKHRMLWLNFDPNFSMKKEIGSRREYSSLKKPKEKFDDDLFKILEEANKLLKVNGKSIIIIGDGKINGETYSADINVVEVAKKLNWILLESSYTFLDNTSRSFRKSFRTKGKKEHILIFKKVS